MTPNGHLELGALAGSRGGSHSSKRRSFTGGGSHSSERRSFTGESRNSSVISGGGRGSLERRSLSLVNYVTQHGVRLR